MRYRVVSLLVRKSQQEATVYVAVPRLFEKEAQVE